MYVCVYIYIYVYKRHNVTPFPYFFCKTRWIEDECVAERAIQLWGSIVQIIKYWQSLSKSKRLQNNKSYDVLVSYHLDPLIVAKLHFFRYIASLLRIFLYSYQTDSPMMSFISSDLYFVTKQLANIIILKEVLDVEVTPYKLINIDLLKKTYIFH